ncbi:MAG: hypothetical protein IJA72_01965 [Clostridia bacterium]|nr:hypothetical protein [Clostridia bacterium]
MTNSSKKILFDETERELVANVRPKKVVILPPDSEGISKSHKIVTISTIISLFLFVVSLIFLAVTDNPVIPAIVMGACAITITFLVGYIIHHYEKDFSIIYADNNEVVEYSNSSIKRSYPSHYKKESRATILAIISIAMSVASGLGLAIYLIFAYNNRLWEIKDTIISIILEIDLIFSIVSSIVFVKKTNRLYSERSQL